MSNALIFVMSMLVGFGAGMLIQKVAHSCPTELKPGKCECGHRRSYHTQGTRDCVAAFNAEAKTVCACMVFIPAEAVATKPDPELDRLRKMAGIQ